MFLSIVHIFPISPSLTSTEIVEDELNWLDQPATFWRANMQKASETHPLTFSTCCSRSLLFSQTSVALSAVTKAVLQAWDFLLLFQRMCQDKAGRGNFCFHQGEKGEGVFSFSEVRSGSQTINLTSEKLFISDAIPGRGSAVKTAALTNCLSNADKKISFLLLNQNERCHCSL